MHQAHRFIAFFNIKPGEEHLIRYLVLLYFVLSLSFVFIQSMAFRVFLPEFGLQGLPSSYIAIAILASFAVIIYTKELERVPANGAGSVTQPD